MDYSQDTPVPMFVASSANPAGEAFYSLFHAKPEFYVKVPGRVNLIGEHIDYSGYSTLPLAIDRYIILACSTVDKPTLNIKNTNRDLPDYNDTIMQFRRKSSEAPMWYDYFRCGAVGTIEDIQENRQNEYRDKQVSNENIDSCFPPIKGLQVVMWGNIPPAAGLSSSSAIVCAASLATCLANNVVHSKLYLARLSARSERLIGTEGGGMDQAIAFLAQAGYAQHIEFNPLKATPVKLPDNVAIIVADTLTKANKAANSSFNTRVKECRLAAQLLTNSKAKTLSEAQKILKKTLDEMIELTKTLPKHSGLLCVQDRALHCYEEAMRVETFIKLCADSNKSNAALKLLRLSHDSLRFKYECSNDTLDQFVQIAGEHDVSARLTGAGWGGCVVMLCEAERAEKVKNMLAQKFYHDNPNVPKDEIDSKIFFCKPQGGAQVMITSLYKGPKWNIPK